MIDPLLQRLTPLVHRALGPVIALSNRVLDRMPRPLDPFRSIKLKLSILLGLSGMSGIIVFWTLLGWIAWRTAIVGAIVGVLTLQVLAHGMTRPLREMTAAARAMARGNYRQRVRATSRDEVGELARAFNVMAADLATADQQRRELIANVSHELRTPITALQGVLENLVDGVSPPDPVTLRSALAQTERLGRLVAELLDLSRIDAGANALDYAALSVRDLLTEIVTQAELFAGETPIVLGSIPGDLRVVADRSRLHQVFANLLDNAVRHSPPGSPVTIAAHRRGASVAFTVADRGPGIPYALREQVFERFTQPTGAAALPRRHGGTGLGLSIARWVAELHQGTIAVIDSPDGTGCHVQVTLPVEPHVHGGLNVHPQYAKHHTAGRR